MPSQDDLCRRLAVFEADSSEYFVFEESFSALSERSPCLKLYMILVSPGFKGELLLMLNKKVQ